MSTAQPAPIARQLMGIGAASRNWCRACRGQVLKTSPRQSPDPDGAFGAGGGRGQVFKSCPRLTRLQLQGSPWGSGPPLGNGTARAVDKF